MIHTSPASDLARTLLGADWNSANETGLLCATAQEWSSAEAAFRHAIAAAPPVRDEPVAHAILLGNLAQAQFHLGEAAGAVDTARQALAARLLSCEDAFDAPMARIRADLAVYLAVCGEHDEAGASLSMARHAIEARFGDFDARLLTILENQALLALAAGQPAAAEPVLLRLHALIGETGGDPSRLEPLLARIVEARRVDERSHSDAGGQADTELDTGVYANVEADEEMATETDENPDIFPVLLDDDAFDLIDDDLHPPMRSPSAQSIRAAGLIEPGMHHTPSQARQTNPLGFEVQYGIPEDILLNGSAAPRTADGTELPSRPSLGTDGGRDNPFW